jgi:hypothetical protein
MDVPKYWGSGVELAFNIFILDGTVSKRSGSGRQYLDLIRLRSHVDRPNLTRKSGLEFIIFIIHGTVSKRGG